MSLKFNIRPLGSVYLKLSFLKMNEKKKTTTHLKSSKRKANNISRPKPIQFFKNQENVTEKKTQFCQPRSYPAPKLSFLGNSKKTITS
jgi:hypothetical protein